jgi:hypothetical protein
MIGLGRQHERLDVPDSRLCPGLFADFYRFESPARLPAPGPRPLICYWGGALRPGDYEKRRLTTPEPVVAAVRTALPTEPPSFDLLVFSLPPVTPRMHESLRLDLRYALAEEILPQTPNPQPSALGYVGFSSGAAVALLLALDVPSSRAVATLGAAGVTELLLDAPRSALARLKLRSFSNADDPIASDTHSFRNALEARGLSLSLHVGAGGHEWDEYAENGSVRQAFSWILDAIFD